MLLYFNEFRKTFFSLAMLMAGIACANAQNPGTSGYWCGEEPLRAIMFDKHPAMPMAETRWEHRWRGKVEAPVAERSTDTVFTVPVVVHIVHQNGPENIPDEQVRVAIDHLNTAFSHTDYYKSNGPGADVGIRFCLANRAPDGEPTSGIVRVSSTLTEVDALLEDLLLKGLSRWDTRSYLNIWVVREINGGSFGKTLSAYAFNAYASGQDFDGIVIEAALMGISPARSNVLAHEVGHYFNLLHTFEKGCPNYDCVTDGDRICDTPPDNRNGGPCVNNSCDTDWHDASLWNPFDEDVDDYTWNFMDYALEACYSGFTPEQVLRMRLALTELRRGLVESRGCWNICPEGTPVVALPRCYGDTTGSIELKGLKGGYPPYVFALERGSYQDTALFEGLRAGHYHIRMRDQKGCDWDTTVVLPQPPLLRVRLEAPARIAPQQPFELRAHISPLPRYLNRMSWTPRNAGLEPVANVFATTRRAQCGESTLFGVRIENEKGCVAADSVWVEVDPDRSVYFPNALCNSDRADGFNRLFFLSGGIGIRDYDLYVYDRWGNCIVTRTGIAPNDAGEGWDGYREGGPVLPGVYMYRAVVRFWDGTRETHTGNVTVVE